MSERDAMTCPVCNAYGTIVLMGRCCSVLKRIEAEQAFNALPRVEQRRVMREQRKGTADAT